MSLLGTSNRLRERHYIQTPAAIWTCRPNSEIYRRLTMIFPAALVWVGTGSLIVCLCVLVVVQLNEVRLEARFLIVEHFSKAGREELDRIEQQFAHKFITKTANTDLLDADDLDLIFIDYLADQYFLKS